MLNDTRGRSELSHAFTRLNILLRKHHRGQPNDNRLLANIATHLTAPFRLVTTGRAPSDACFPRSKAVPDPCGRQECTCIMVNTGHNAFRLAGKLGQLAKGLLTRAETPAYCGPTAPVVGLSLPQLPLERGGGPKEGDPPLQPGVIRIVIALLGCFTSKHLPSHNCTVCNVY